MNIVPFDNLILVRVLKGENKTSGGIVLPQKFIGRYARYELLAMGPTVSWKEQVEIGDVLLGKSTPEDEELDDDIKLMNAHDIYAKEAQEN